MSKKQESYCYIYDVADHLKYFYKDGTNLSFKGLTPQKISELKNFSIALNKKYNSNGFHRYKSIRYSRITEEIRCNPERYNIENPIEKYLLFMFSVDPTFEAAIIFGESNTVEEAKTKLRKHFEVYDPCLVRIEQIYIKHFISPKKQEEIKKEIERRVFK